MLNLENKTKISRPSWDEYFLRIAETVSSRSDDVFIKHGAVLVDDKNHIIGTGYNGLPKKFNSSLIDIHNRDARRIFMTHAETNCLLNSTSKSDYMKLYVTGRPCISCLINMVNFGIKDIIYLDRCGSITENEEYENNFYKIVESCKIGLKMMNLDKEFSIGNLS